MPTPSLAGERYVPKDDAVRVVLNNVRRHQQGLGNALDELEGLLSASADGKVKAIKTKKTKKA